MKKITALLLAGIMAVGLCACGESTDATLQPKGTESVKGGDAVTYVITYNANEGNVEGMPNYQFLGADMSGIAAYDSRLNIEIILQLDGNGKYELKSDCYVIEADERQEVGSETGIGQNWVSDVAGTYEENADGTITISAGQSMTLKVETDTYSSQMKDAVGFSINGSSDDGEWNSTDTPEILVYAPETVFTIAGGAIVSYYNPNDVEETVDTEAVENDITETTEAAEAQSADGVLLEVPSDDEGTSFTFYNNGTYAFYFASYDITDIGTYTYADEVLTIIDKNGTETVGIVDEETVKFHYEYSDSDQLTGDYTITVSDLEEALNK